MAEIQVPGATLHYTVRGSGPPLLLLTSGGRDADNVDTLADHCAGTHQVITYDRRGMVRSPQTDPAEVPSLATHAHDAHLLLTQLCQEPASVFGGSTGAVIALELTTRHPSQIRTLIAHEPPALSLLERADRAGAIEFAHHVAATFRTKGRMAAAKIFGQDYATALTDREPDQPWPRPTPRQTANLDLFLALEATTTAHHVLDRARLLTLPVPVFPARGSTSRAVVPCRGAEALATLLSTEVTLFPGGHEGYISHPRAFAGTLLSLLSGSRLTTQTAPTSRP